MRELGLEILHTQGFSLRFVAQEVGKNVSSFSRGIRRNKDPGRGTYHYSFAHKMAQSRRKQANILRVKIKLGSELEAYIFLKLKLN